MKKQFLSGCALACLSLFGFITHLHAGEAEDAALIEADPFSDFRSSGLQCHRLR